jgi:hypothetical protein
VGWGTANRPKGLGIECFLDCEAIRSCMTYLLSIYSLSMAAHISLPCHTEPGIHGSLFKTTCKWCAAYCRRSLGCDELAPQKGSIGGDPHCPRKEVGCRCHTTHLQLLSLHDFE